MHDPPSGPALLALARAVLSGELAPLLPPERRDEARRVAAAMAIAEREAAAGEAPFRAILGELAVFYECEDPSPRAHPNPPPHAGEGMGGGRRREGDDAPDLLRRFADDLRRGAFAAAPEREEAARALMWRLTIAKLRIENPEFLAANGFP